MEELARVVGAVTEARPVEALMGPIHLLCCVSLHEQVHGHYPGCLQKNNKQCTFPIELQLYWHIQTYKSYLLGKGVHTFNLKRAVFFLQSTFVNG